MFAGVVDQREHSLADPERIAFCGRPVERPDRPQALAGGDDVVELLPVAIEAPRVAVLIDQGWTPRLLERKAIALKDA